MPPPSSNQFNQIGKRKGKSMDIRTIIQAMTSGLMLGCVFSLVAAGLSLIFGVMSFINFAHGDMLMVGLYCSYWLWALLGLDPLLSWPLTVIVVCVLGFIMYEVTIKKVLESERLIHMMVSFGTMMFLRSVAQFLFTANYRLIKNPILDGHFNLAGKISVGIPQLIAGLGAIVSSVALYWFLEKTELGKVLRAVSSNREAAPLMGIDVDVANRIAWIIASACVGIAAALLSSYYFVFPDVGAIFGTIAVVTVAMGGFGNVLGAFVAGLAIGLIVGVGGILIGPAYKYALVFVIFIIVLLLRTRQLAMRS